MTTYASVEFADDYLAVKGAIAEDWLAQDEPDKTAWLDLAARTLDQRMTIYPSHSRKTDPDQDERFPRTAIVNRDGESVPDDEIPLQLSEATVEFAFHLFSNPDTSGQPAIQRIKVAVVEISYAESSGATDSIFPPAINQLLYPFASVATGNGSRSVAINRA